jgi:hypothetical protein
MLILVYHLYAPEKRLNLFELGNAIILSLYSTQRILLTKSDAKKSPRL